MIRPENRIINKECKKASVVEHELLLRVKALKKDSSQVTFSAAVIGAEIAKIAQRFDYTVISGRSAHLASVILLGNNIKKGTVISFSPLENENIYKLHTPFNLTERTARTKTILERRKISSEGNSFCIVDDHIDTGKKAIKYLQIFGKLPGITNVAFTTLSAVAFTNCGKKEKRLITKDLNDKLILPSILYDPRYVDAQFFYIRMANLLSSLAQYKNDPAQIFPATLQEARAITSQKLRELFTECKKLEALQN